MWRKNLTVAIMLSVFLASPVIAGQDAADAAAEAAGAYLSSAYILQAAKKNTVCGYAVLLDFDEIARKAEQDVIHNIPSKFKKDVTNFIPKLKHDSQGIMEKYLKDLDGKYDNKTRCGIMVGGFIAIFGQSWKGWEIAKKNL